MLIHPLYIYKGPRREQKQRKGKTSKHCNFCPNPTHCAKFGLWGDPPSPGLPQCDDAVKILQDHWTAYNFWSASKSVQAPKHVTLLYCIIMIWTSVNFSQQSFLRHKSFAMDFSAAVSWISTDQAIVQRCMSCTMSHLHRQTIILERPDVAIPTSGDYDLTPRVRACSLARSLKELILRFTQGRWWSHWIGW